MQREIGERNQRGYGRGCNKLGLLTTKEFRELEDGRLSVGPAVGDGRERSER